MSPQFCKIGKSNSKKTKISKLKKRYKLKIEQAYNISFTDSSLIDILYYEASKIKKLLISAKHRGVAF